MSGSDCTGITTECKILLYIVSEGYWSLYNQRKTINKALDCNSATQHIGHAYAAQPRVEDGKD